MKKQLLFLAALLLISLTVSAQKKYTCYAVGFYNQENLFDTCHDAGKNDYEYLPNGSAHWDNLPPIEQELLSSQRTFMGHYYDVLMARISHFD